MDFPFPDSADDLLAILVSEYQPADLVPHIMAGRQHEAVALAAQIDLVNTLIEWRADTLAEGTMANGEDDDASV